MLANKFKQIWRGALTGTLLVSGLGVALLKFDNIPGATKLEHLSYDLPFLHRPIIKPEEVVIVYMDEDSHRELGQSYFGPWDREMHARLLNRLTAEHARAVVFDILFTDLNKEHPEGDERFARALAENGKSILGAEFTHETDGDPTVHLPIDPFLAAAAGWGMVQVLPDQDFIVRKHLHVPPDPNADNISSISWEAAELLGAKVAKDGQNRFKEKWLNYYGPPGTIPTISFVRTMETNKYCPAGVFSNKVVFIGGAVKTHFSGERKDEYRTPFTKANEWEPAVDIQVTQFLNLMRGDWLMRLSDKIQLVLIVATGILFGFGLTFFRPVVASGLAILCAVIVTLIAHFLFWKYRLSFSWMIIVAVQISIACLWSIVFNSIHLYVQNKIYEHSLAVYLSPKLVKKFAKSPALLKPGAEKQTLTLFFSDIADFTSISEGMDSDELAVMTNQYFRGAVSNCIHKTDGTVVKYIGDGIFAFWNAPDPQSDHQTRACEAALLFGKLATQPIHGRLLRTRIGLHTGVVNVGNFGSEERIDYTALGENVNLASRLEGLNKYLGTTCVISAETKAGIGERLVTRPLGSFQLKGFQNPVQVHELIDWPDQAEATRPWREMFAQALENYEQRNLEFAEIGFRRVLELHPEDGPAKFYLERIAELAKQELPDGWVTHTIFKEK